jgi:hypothetical protein
MRYQVPQFIEIEDKIFGPLTFKQFAYIVGGVGVGLIAYKLLSLFWAIIVMVPVAIVSGSLAFYRPNNRPFIDTLEAAFNFVLTSKLYIWHKEDKKINPSSTKQIMEAAKSSVMVPKLSQSKLKDLTWSLDINETIYSRESGKLEGRKGGSQNPF